MTNTHDGPFTANGSTTAFPFTFAAVSVDDVLPVRVTSDGKQIVLNDYSVRLDDDNPGGTVTFEIAPPAGDPIYILLNPTFEQQTTFANQGSFSPSSVNKVNDRAALRDLYLKNLLDRSLKVPFGEENETQIPSASVRAGKFLAFGVGGEPIASSGTGADAGLRGDLAAETGSSLIGDLSGPLSARPRRLTYGHRTPLRTDREASEALDTLHTQIVGYAAYAGTTGGYGYPKFYVNNASMNEGVAHSFGWALAQAQTAGGGQIYFSPMGDFRVELITTLILNYSNVTIYAPGLNVTFWLDRLSGFINMTAASNWIFKNIYFRVFPGPINGFSIGDTVTEASSLINVHADACDKLAFLNCEFRHPSWHCLDISRHSVTDGSNPCRASVQNCIFWDSIQAHLLGTDIAKFDPSDYTNDSSPRQTFVTFHETIWAYNLQRNPKILGNCDVDIASCYTLLRAYENEYILNKSGDPDTRETMTDIFGVAVQDGGWARVRGSLFTSAQAEADAGYATELLYDVAFSGYAGRLSVVGSTAEQSLVVQTKDSDLIPALPYTLDCDPVPDAGPAREAWLADLWAKAGARPDAAPDGWFLWEAGDATWPNGENVLIERGHDGRWKRIDAPSEYPPLPESGSSTLYATARSYSRTVGYFEGRATRAAIGASTLDLGGLDSPYLSVLGNGGASDVKLIMASDSNPFPDGMHLYISGSPSVPVTLKQAATTPVTGVELVDANSVTVTSHGLVTGDWPVYLTSTGTLPTGLVSKQAYYAVVVDAETIKFALSYDDAISAEAGSVVQISDAGSGTHTLHIGNLNLPNGADLVLNAPAKVTHLIWDAANLQFDVVSRHALQAAEITDLPATSQAATSSMTYAAASGGTTVDTQARASQAQLAADFADFRAKMRAAGFMA